MDTVDHLGIPEHIIDSIAADELKELERRELAYRGNRPEPDVKGKTDGLMCERGWANAVGKMRGGRYPWIFGHSYPL